MNSVRQPFSGAVVINTTSVSMSTLGRPIQLARVSVLFCGVGDLRHAQRQVQPNANVVCTTGTTRRCCHEDVLRQLPEGLRVDHLCIAGHLRMNRKAFVAWLVTPLWSICIRAHWGHLCVKDGR